jgi:hypothetical protein
LSWARLDDRYPQHRKLRAAGSLRPLCIALDVTGICHCAEYATDGFIADADLPGVLEDAGLSRGKQLLVLDKLVEVGRWHRDNEAGGYWIHDFLTYNPSAADRRQAAERAKERAAASRARKEGAAHVQRTGQSGVRKRATPRPVPPVPKGGDGAPRPPAASPSPAQDAGSAADDPDPRPPLHVVAPDRPPPPKLSDQLRAGNGQVPDAARHATDAVFGTGWRDKVRPRSDVDPAEFEAERQRQIAAIREQYGEQFAAEFEHEPTQNESETEHEVSTDRTETEHGTSTG